MSVFLFVTIRQKLSPVQHVLYCSCIAAIVRNIVFIRFTKQLNNLSYLTQIALTAKKRSNNFIAQHTNKASHWWCGCHSGCGTYLLVIKGSILFLIYWVQGEIFFVTDWGEKNKSNMFSILLRAPLMLWLDLTLKPSTCWGLSTVSFNIKSFC